MAIEWFIAFVIYAYCKDLGDKYCPIFQRFLFLAGPEIQVENLQN